MSRALAFGVNTLCRYCKGTGGDGGEGDCGVCLGVGFIGEPPSTPHPNSQEAADAIRTTAAHQRAVVLAAIKEHGPVSDQRLERLTGLSGNSIRPRRGELEAAGLIVHAGKGTTESGRTCDLWRAA